MHVSRTRGECVCSSRVAPPACGDSLLCPCVLFTTCPSCPSTRFFSVQRTFAAGTQKLAPSLSIYLQVSTYLRFPESISSMSGEGRSIAFGMVSSSVVLSVGLYYALKVASANIREGLLGLSISLDAMR